jgi:hypothetical protein
MTDDAHLSELTRQCADATQLKRLAGVEQLEVFNWLLNNGHMTRTGKPLQRPRQAPVPIAYSTEGKPIFKPGTDFATHETVEMTKR